MMMANSLRSPYASSLFSYSLRNHFAVRFAQGVSGSNRPDTSQKTDPLEGHESKSGETKYSSRGGYAKRSDEAGYGAEYGGNQSLSGEDEDKIVHGNAPEYDKSKKSS